MSADLGARLQRAGLVTREQLAETLASAPLHGAAFVRALLRRGIAEDALVGYFLAEGFGPLISAAELAGADRTLAAQVPASVLEEFAALPLRAVSGDGRQDAAEGRAGRGGHWIVAMIAPTERHAVSELERIARVQVVPAVARWSELRPALAAIGADGHTDPSERPASEPPPVIELVRRRSQAPLGGYQAATRDGSRDAKLDADDAVPLVRHKPVTRRTPTPSSAETVIARSFAPPPNDANDAPRDGAHRGWRRATRPIGTDDDAPPSSASSGSHRVSSPTPLELATASAVEALPSESAPPPSEPYRQRIATEPRSVPLREAPPRTPTLAPPGFTPSFTTGVTPGFAQRAGRPPTPERHDEDRLAGLASADLAQVALAGASDGTGVLDADERWDAPSHTPRAPRAARSAPNKLAARAARALVPVKAPLGEVRGSLVAIRHSGDRDEIVRLALEGALSVARSGVFFALRKGVLRGWDGLGAGVSADSARNLWIPTSTPSLFQRVVEAGAGYFGPYGTAIADGLFRAAVGSRGGEVALLPVKVSGKVVGLLACDDVRGGPQGQQRLELLAASVEAAFARIIVKQKRG